MKILTLSGIYSLNIIVGPLLENCQWSLSSQRLPNLARLLLSNPCLLWQRAHWRPSDHSGCDQTSFEGWWAQDMESDGKTKVYDNVCQTDDIYIILPKRHYSGILQIWDIFFLFRHFFLHFCPWKVSGHSQDHLVALNVLVISGDKSYLG